MAFATLFIWIAQVAAGGSWILMSDSEEEKNEDLNIDNDVVKTKYKTAGTIVNDVLKLLCKEAKIGVTPLELCELGDNTLTQMLTKVYHKHDHLPTKTVRGIAFPTCINVNEIVCHYSPLPEGQVPLKAGDVVKIDLGAQIDGFPVVAAHTIVVQEEEKPITGRIADLMQAAKLMMDVAVRGLRPGKKNNDIPPLLEKIAEAYGVNICEGVLSHQMKRYVLDGNQCILAKTNVERRVDDVVFASGQVWTVDIALSSGKGKLFEGNSRCCVYKRNPDQQYMLKLKASKEALREIDTRFKAFPFSIRALDPKSGRLGVSECLKHELVLPYPVLYEKTGEDVVHLKSTVFVFNNLEVAAGLDPQQQFVSEKKCEDAEIQEIAQSSLSVKKKSKKKTGGKADVEEAA
eukprot:GGOE01012932.1.p2 GENE.GGOE01012932.1~~GGOE01012932.1.p2  ORF type:complete len:403 (-),score=88.69 GGOE01012932.1:178-1386(-)